MDDEEVNKLLVWVQNLLWDGRVSNREKLERIKRKLEI